MTPESKRRDVASEHVVYMAVRLSEALDAVAFRAQWLEDRLISAADQGVPRTEAEAMTRDLPGIDVTAMLDKAYAQSQEA